MTRIVAAVAAVNVASLAVAIAKAREQGADLAELRLDLCRARGAEPATLLAMLDHIRDYELPLIVTNRHADEGGAWTDDEESRLQLLLRADAAGAAYIDVELARLAGLPQRPQRARLILSQHDFTGMGGDLSRVLDRMFQQGADLAKVAVTPHDAADLNTLAELAISYGEHAETPHQIIVLGMGEVGLPSRLLAGAWGAAATFGRLQDDDEGTAPGQPTVAELKNRYRVDRQNIETRIFGIVGDPVGHSLSPLIHNAALQYHDIDGVYVPFLAKDPVAFWRACGDWIDGLSITLPHKTAMIGEMHEMEELALQIGAMNTIYRDYGDPGRCIGANTDAPAAVECVEDHVATVRGRRVLLLGAGGVSRAIAMALHLAGAQVFIANRTAKRAADLAAAVGCQAISVRDSLNLRFDILINGTSVGMQSDESPWPAHLHRPDTLVFDTVYTPLETRLLIEAQAAGATCVCGLSMLIKQALGQFHRWTGREVPAPLLYRLALEALGFDWPDSACAPDA